MALGINTIWESRVTATAANVNGAGFNPENAGFLTDLTTDANTGNTATPVVSSASYNFVAGDVGAYVFVQAGTNWFPGWYLISSVAANKATLSAASGTPIWYTSGVARVLFTSTSAGVASVATPTNGTWTIDYSQQDVTGYALTALTSAGAGNVVLSAAATPVMIGNIARVNSGTNFTTGWFEVASVVAGVSMTFTTNQAGTGICTGVGANGALNIGGASSLQSAAGATDDAFFENGLGTSASGASIFFIKNGSYAAMGSISLAAVGTGRASIQVIGYNTIRTSTTAPAEANRPILTFGANVFTFTTGWELMNLITMGTATTVLTLGNGSKAQRCKCVNNSTTASRASIASSANSRMFVLNCESMSYRGSALDTTATTANSVIGGCYLHGSRNGILNQATTGIVTIYDCLIEDNAIAGINISAANSSLSLNDSNTIIGATNQLGSGILIQTGAGAQISRNNNIWGCVTPINQADTQATAGGNNFNNYFNNTNANSNSPAGRSDTAIDPSFFNVVQRTGSTATTTAGNHLVQAGATFQTWGVTAGVDILYLVSGTGTTNAIHYSILSVDSETQITVGETLTADATADKVWQITTGHDYRVGGNDLKIAGFPGIFPAALTTSYKTTGAVQSAPGGPPFIIGG